MSALYPYGNEGASAQEASPTSIKDVDVVSLQAALWARNERESRLLQLPAEIRLQIFDYVIGSWVIHVHLSWHDMISGFKYRCLEDTQPCVEYYRSGYRPGYYRRGSPKATLPFDPSITILSTVCRQLYRETAALPFKKFTWAFDTAFTLERFLSAEKKTNFHNKSAIRTVLVPLPGPYRSSEQILSDLRTILLAGCYNPMTHGFDPPIVYRSSFSSSPIITLTLNKVKSSNTWMWNDEHAEFAKDLFEKPALPRKRKTHAS